MYRTWMFVPGSQDKHLNKAKDLRADVLIFDLEDAVSTADKAIARNKVKNCIENLENRVNFVRVNSLSTPHFLKDIQRIADSNLDGIVLPKTNEREDVIITDYLLEQLELKHGFESHSLSIVPIIETGKGLQNAYTIACASKRVQCLCFGVEDFQLDMDIETDEAEFQLMYARSQLVTASKAAGKQAPIDSVYIDFNDHKGLKDSANNGRKFGFQGKLVIHPMQIELINQVFSPTSAQIKEAKQIVEMYDFEEGGATQIEGKMVDFPVAEQARKMLARIEE